MRLRLRRSCLGVDEPSVSQGHWRHRGMVHLISSQPLESHATPLATIFHYDIMRVMACLAVVLLHLAATIVMDDYHFLSDVIWGGAMGFAIGQWVVHHRANTSVAHGKTKPLFMVVPMVSPKGSGLAAGFTF